MAAITIRNLSDETHRALKARAARNHRSTEAEVRAILDAAAASGERVRLGALLTEIGASVGGLDLPPRHGDEPHEPLDLT